jgi:NADH dehydrogenase I D subunit
MIELNLKKIQHISLNFGPQHPAAHGVLRLVLQLKGELIIHADPHIGLLHRGTEKLIEGKPYFQNLPYFDRLDYVSMLAYEHTYILAIETLLNIKISKKDSYIRIIFMELTRILNHLLCIGCQAMDLGAVTPYFLGFEEREQISELYEQISGARMHAAFFRPGGLSNPVSTRFLQDVFCFIEKFNLRLFEIKTLLDNNRIWKDRLINIGIITKQAALELGCTGVMLRGSGHAIDLRKTKPYELYSTLNFQIPVGQIGDCFDRYLIRMEEMFQSIQIIQQCCKVIQNLSEEKTPQPYHFQTSKQELKNSMEALIEHYKIYSEGYSIPANNVLVFTEAPKGQFGIHLFSDGSNLPYRCKIIAPGFNHLQSLNNISKGHLIADLVTIIGSLDIVFGEIDR